VTAGGGSLDLEALHHQRLPIGARRDSRF